MRYSERRTGKNSNPVCPLLTSASLVQRYRRWQLFGKDDSNSMLSLAVIGTAGIGTSLNDKPPKDYTAM